MRISRRDARLPWKPVECIQFLMISCGEIIPVSEATRVSLRFVCLSSCVPDMILCCRESGGESLESIVVLVGRRKQRKKING